MKILICDAKAEVRNQMRELVLTQNPEGEIEEFASTEALAECASADLEQAVVLCGYQTVKQFFYPKEKSAVLLTTKKRTYTFWPDQILYAENDGKKIILHTKNDDIAIYATMKELCSQLGDGFFRCHRGYLVNLRHIKSYSGDSIQMDNGECVYLARGKYRDFVKCYHQMMGKRLSV